MKRYITLFEEHEHYDAKDHDLRHLIDLHNKVDSYFYHNFDDFEFHVTKQDILIGYIKDFLRAFVSYEMKISKKLDLDSLFKSYQTYSKEFAREHSYSSAHKLIFDEVSDSLDDLEVRFNLESANNYYAALHTLLKFFIYLEKELKI